MTENLVMDEKAIAEMGFIGTPIFTIEYDLHSKLTIPKNLDAETKKTMEENNTLAVEFRNKLFFILKFKVMATRHLESSWIITKQNLATAITELEELKTLMKEKGFSDVDSRIKIIPVLTTAEGVEHYQNKKAQFLIDFLNEHIEYCNKALDKGKIAKSTVWRCKKTVEIVTVLKQEVKANSKYAEIEAALSELVKLIGEVEPLTEIK